MNRLNFFMIQRFIPHGPSKSVMYYEVYRNKNASEDDFQLINEMYKRVMSEDKALCELAQRNVNNGVFINGEMHPRLEMGPLYIQKLCREDVTEIHRRDQASKRSSWGVPQILFKRDQAVFGGSGLMLEPASELGQLIAAH